jgi:hypothetical protein
MQVQIKATSDGVGYASKNDYEYEGKSYEADIKNGDRVKVLNAGTIEEGNFGPQHYFKIMTRNGEKKAAFNQSSINVVASTYGTETEAWVGKELTVLTKKGVFAGKKGIAAYFVTEGWYLDDFGDLVNEVVIQHDPIVTPRSANAQAVEDIRNMDVEEPLI